MASAWSSADPGRRRLFLAGMAMIAALLGWVGYEMLTAPPPAAPSQPPPGPSIPVEPTTQETILVPPGHEDGDVISPPATTLPPLRLPPRYDKAPSLPVSAADLDAATDLAMTFVELFGNSRWDDKAEDKIQAIGAFVPQPSLDLVLAEYERTRAKLATHETVTFRVTGAKWWSLSDRQATLLVTGDRHVVDDDGSRTAARGYVLTLTRGGDGWKVTRVRDPADGDAGMGSR